MKSLLRWSPCIGAALALTWVLLLATPSAQAVILYNSQWRNKSAPTGTYANSGWQWQGKWNGFLGTPIAPNYFITAGHVGGAVGGTFTLNGVNYTTTEFKDDPNSDLRIWKISGTFKTYAPLYKGTSETGKTVVIFGRGTQRGQEVRKNNVLKGWKWGVDDRVQSWGLNQISQIGSGGTGLGQLFKMNFDAGKINEGALSIGDSGGAIFLNDNGVWKLAGINYAADGPFSLTGASGSGFSASIFDKGGLYTPGSGGGWTYNTDTLANIPGASYATRISSNLSWITSVIGTSGVAQASAFSTTGNQAIPEPSLIGLVGISGAFGLLARRRRPKDARSGSHAHQANSSSALGDLLDHCLSCR